MGALPRPDLPPGPRRELNDALHDLHHQAGWPSLRTLAAAAGCSHTTVSKVFSAPPLPSWGVVELLVEAMDGHVRQFHDLWLAASASAEGGRPLAAPPIAGRRAELLAARRHLASGSGLLVVAGEAGMGKTRLVTTAAATADETLVVHASCLPLATEVPLLPWAEALQQVAAVDDGRWLNDSLAGTPRYVREVLSRLVPDLATAESRPMGDGSRTHLFLAVATALTALHGSRTWALLLEDLHWADPDTLDLLEHLLARGTTVPVLGTWRLDDPDVEPHVRQWWARVRRTASVVELGPMTRDETAVQLEMVTGAPPDDAAVERIHARTGGLPLFTEQLAAAGGPDEQVPRLLDDLLVQRLGDLSPEGWEVAAVLGAADRPLRLDVLREACPPETGALSAGLHELADRYLLRDDDQTGPSLRHPLLAEAVRRRLLPPEAAEVHRRLAEALGGAGEPAAEVAGHWQQAGDPVEELQWWVAAALEAGERFALRLEWTLWRRALDLWGDDTGPVGPAPGVTLVAALTRGCYTARSDGDLDALGPVAERLLEASAAEDVAAVDRAGAAAQAGMSLSLLGDSRRGAALYEEAVRIYRHLGMTSELVPALCALAGMRAELDDLEGGLALAREALEEAERFGEETLWRRAAAHLAVHEGLAGHHDRAQELLHRAAHPRDPGPTGAEIEIAFMLTAAAVITQLPATDFEQAGGRAWETVTRWGLDGFGVRILRSNLTQGYLAAGQVERASLTLGDPPDDMAADDMTRPLRARIDVAQGRLDDAARTLEALAELPLHGSAAGDVALQTAQLEVWRGQLRPARARLEALFADGLDDALCKYPEDQLLLPQALLLLTRTSADLAAVEGHGPRARGEAAARLRELGRHLPVDPFGAHLAPAPRRAWRETLAAELARLEGSETTEQWAAVAAAWDPADRPHDAAYCRWRAAQVALRKGQATAATRLLARARRDAREHVPLSAAIDRTAAYALGP